MKKSSKKRSVWWILIVAILIGGIVGGLLWKQLNRKTMQPLPQEQSQQSPGISKAESQTPLPRERENAGQAPLSSKREAQQEIGAEEIQEIKKDNCKELATQIMEFLNYLDSKKYIQHLELGEDMISHFRSIITRLSSRPPVPAGEGVDPRLIASNVYHFYRALGRKDIRLIKEILQNEEDTLEINLDIFFRWFEARDKCPDSLGLRPSFKIAYRYAGFLLNAIGGRAYLLRRSMKIRLLATYYAILIVHEADLKGLNTYGIDVLPYVASLKQELRYFPGLEYQSDYMDRLYEIEDYYIGKR